MYDAFIYSIQDPVESIKELYKQHTLLKMSPQFLASSLQVNLTESVPVEVGEDLGKELGCPVIEVSTEENMNVNELFEEFVRILLPNNPKKSKDKKCNIYEIDKYQLLK